MINSQYLLKYFIVYITIYFIVYFLILNFAYISVTFSEFKKDPINSLRGIIKINLLYSFGISVVQVLYDIYKLKH